MKTAEAIFNAASEQWELGKRDAKGRPVGEWKYWWATTGHLCCVCRFEDRGRKAIYTRFHPDGTYSRKGINVDGKPAPNEVIYYQKARRLPERRRRREVRRRLQPRGRRQGPLEGILR